ncbi:Enoyl-CoA delta isomerase 2, partial [Manis javanica]
VGLPSEGPGAAGNGDYYCSGNDLTNFMDVPPWWSRRESQKWCHSAEGICRLFYRFP